MGQWLTPNSAPTGFTCRRLLIPDQEDWLAIVSGCLYQLAQRFSFEQFGTATPEETAAKFAIMFDEFTFGGCHMVGEIFMWASQSTDPPGWNGTDPVLGSVLRCNGFFWSSDDFPDLYAVIGDDWGEYDEDGIHYFAVPDLRLRFPFGANGLGVFAGNYGGENSHVLTVDEMPEHSHSEITAVTAIINGGLEAPASSAVPGVASTGNTGGGQDHNNIPAYAGVYYFIQAR